MKTRQLIAIILGLIALYKTWQSQYSDDLIDGFIWMGLILSGLMLGIICFIKDYRYYRIEKNWTSFSSTFTFTGIVLVIAAFGLKINHDFNKPSLVKAGIKVDLGHISIDLKKDGSYIFTNAFFIGATYIHGTYAINGDTITLDRAKLDNVIHSDKMVLTKKETEPYLIELNPTSNDIYDEYWVTEDNRK
jgi:hypothetical protein